MVYNTLLEVNNLSSVRMDLFVPSALSTSPHVYSRNWSSFSRHWGNIGHYASIVLISVLIINIKLWDSDMWCRRRGGDSAYKGLKMTSSINDLCQRTHIKQALIKTYLSRLDMVWVQCMILLSTYKDVAILRSDFSTIQNTEVFLDAGSSESPIPYEVVNRVTHGGSNCGLI